jgi:dimethylamine/trimethylamine dehydrogenase
MYTERVSEVAAASIVTVTSRTANTDLAAALDGRAEEARAAGIISVNSIGDCLAPSTIAAAVYAGHRHAREFDLPPGDGPAFRRELPLAATDLAARDESPTRSSTR